MVIYVKFYHDHSLNIVMSMTLAANFKNLYFPSNSILNFRESYQIWDKLAQEQKRYRQKAKLGVEPSPPPPPSA